MRHKWGERYTPKKVIWHGAVYCVLDDDRGCFGGARRFMIEDDQGSWVLASECLPVKRGKK